MDRFAAPPGQVASKRTEETAEEYCYEQDSGKEQGNESDKNPDCR